MIDLLGMIRERAKTLTEKEIIIGMIRTGMKVKDEYLERYRSDLEELGLIKPRKPKVDMINLAAMIDEAFLGMSEEEATEALLKSGFIEERDDGYVK